LQNQLIFTTHLWLQISTIQAGFAVVWQKISKIPQISATAKIT